ncbi:MAG: methyl-accepting chemotaxis protein [Spirochaetales bacterium]|nr:methyl-accepting chemotaxis protein [Spirochaetales bacterium]
MFEKLLSYYNDHGDITIRYRAKALVKVDFAAILLFMVFVVINFLEKDYIASIIEIGLLGLLITNIFMVKKGKYKAAVNMVLTICFLAAIMLITASPKGNLHEAFMFFSYAMPTLVALTLFGYSRIQALIFVISGEIFMVYSLFLRTMPSGQFQSGELIKHYSTPMLLFIICIYFVGQVIDNSTRIFGSLSNQEEITRKRFNDLNDLVSKFKLNQNLGRDLHGLAENTSENTEEITDRLKDMEEVLDKLNSAMQTTSGIQDIITNAGKEVSRGMGSQTESLQNSSASVEEMARSITSLSNTMQTGVVALNNLKEDSAKSEARIKESGKMMDAMLESNKKINEITAVIEDVGSQTNLLAMNASIEAAHAGEVGKGFAVVAGEIRKLAETTNTQSRQIRELLEVSNENSLAAVKQSREVQEHFVEIMHRIEDQSAAMSGVYDSLTELTGNAGEITRDVSTLMDANSSVNSSVQNMTGKIDESHKTVSSTTELTREVLRLMTEIRDSTASLSRDARTLADIGKENTDNLHNMERELQMLH